MFIRALIKLDFLVKLWPKPELFGLKSDTFAQLVLEELSTSLFVLHVGRHWAKTTCEDRQLLNLDCMCRKVCRRQDLSPWPHDQVQLVFASNQFLNEHGLAFGLVLKDYLRSLEQSQDTIGYFYDYLELTLLEPKTRVKAFLNSSVRLKAQSRERERMTRKFSPGGFFETRMKINCRMRERTKFFGGPGNC